MHLLRGGDTVKVTRLDRLSRSVLYLVTLGADLGERGMPCTSSSRASTPRPSRGRAVFGMLSVLAELQPELIVANTSDGLASARARGRVGGRRPKLTAGQAALVQQLYDARDKTVQQDRRPLRRTRVDGVRAPRPRQHHAPPAEEGRYREALMAIWRSFWAGIREQRPGESTRALKPSASRTRQA